MISICFLASPAASSIHPTRSHCVGEAVNYRGRRKACGYGTLDLLQDCLAMPWLCHC
jgi:hypothetical protein